MLNRRFVKHSHSPIFDLHIKLINSRVRVKWQISISSPSHCREAASDAARIAVIFVVVSEVLEVPEC
jgi:hypothetical protein